MRIRPTALALRRLALALLALCIGVLGAIVPLPTIAYAREMGVETRALNPSEMTAATVDVDPFAMVGVSFQSVPVADPPADLAEDAVQVRTQGGAGWSEWHHLEAMNDEGPDAAGTSRWFSHPVWVADATGFELSLPDGVDAVQVHLVREEERREIRDDAPAAEAAQDGPTIQTRARWGARSPSATPSSASSGVQFAIVHHTGNTADNSYSSGEVPSMLRGIQAYHMDARGWNDIGYNFVVDRFGRIWEGRGGGRTRSIIGAHAAGFNTGSTGISLLGNFDTITPTAAAIEAIGRLIGWKLSFEGVSPTSSHTYTSGGSTTIPAGRRVTLPRVIGHGDVGSTSCPGSTLYSRLPQIRSIAADALRPGGGLRPPIPVTSINGTYTPVAGDFNGDGRDDVLYYGAGTAADYLQLGNAAGGFTPGPRPRIDGAYPAVRAGDWNGDGRSDLLFYRPGTGRDFIRLGSSTGRFVGGPAVTMNGRYFPYAGDINGDGRDDVLLYGPGTARDYLSLGTTAGGLSPGPRPIIDGTYRLAVGDFSGDGRADLLRYRSGPNNDYMSLGTSSGRFTSGPRPVINATYTPYAGDFDESGRDDVLLIGEGRTADSLLRGQAGGALRLGPAVRFDGVYRRAVGDFNGDGRSDLLLYAAGPLADFVAYGAA